MEDWINPDDDVVLGALYAALNIEGCAKAGGRLPGWDGLDVTWHFARVREAIKAREEELRARKGGR